MALDDMIGTHPAFGPFNFRIDLGQGVAQVLARVVAFNLDRGNLFFGCHAFCCHGFRRALLRGPFFGCRDCR